MESSILFQVHKKWEENEANAMTRVLQRIFRCVEVTAGSVKIGYIRLG